MTTTDQPATPAPPDDAELRRALTIVADGRAYTREHFRTPKTTYVGHTPSDVYDAAIDTLVAGLTHLLNGADQPTAPNFVSRVHARAMHQATPAFPDIPVSHRTPHTYHQFNSVCAWCRPDQEYARLKAVIAAADAERAGEQPADLREAIIEALDTRVAAAGITDPDPITSADFADVVLPVIQAAAEHRERAVARWRAEADRQATEVREMRAAIGRLIEAGVAEELGRRREQVGPVTVQHSPEGSYVVGAPEPADLREAIARALFLQAHPGCESTWAELAPDPAHDIPAAAAGAAWYRLADVVVPVVERHIADLERELDETREAHIEALQREMRAYQEASTPDATAGDTPASAAPADPLTTLRAALLDLEELDDPDREWWELKVDSQILPAVRAHTTADARRARAEGAAEALEALSARLLRHRDELPHGRSPQMDGRRIGLEDAATIARSLAVEPGERAARTAAGGGK